MTRMRSTSGHTWQRCYLKPPWVFIREDHAIAVTETLLGRSWFLCTSHGGTLEGFPHAQAAIDYADRNFPLEARNQQAQRVSE